MLFKGFFLDYDFFWKHYMGFIHKALLSSFQKIMNLSIWKFQPISMACSSPVLVRLLILRNQTWNCSVYIQAWNPHLILPLQLLVMLGFIVISLLSKNRFHLSSSYHITPQLSILYALFCEKHIKISFEKRRSWY